MARPYTTITREKQATDRITGLIRRSGLDTGLKSDPGYWVRLAEAYKDLAYTLIPTKRIAAHPELVKLVTEARDAFDTAEWLWGLEICISQQPEEADALFGAIGRGGGAVEQVTGAGASVRGEVCEKAKALAVLAARCVALMEELLRPPVNASPLMRALVTAALHGPAAHLARWTTREGAACRAAVWHDQDAADQAWISDLFDGARYFQWRYERPEHARARYQDTVTEAAETGAVFEPTEPMQNDDGSIQRR